METVNRAFFDAYLEACNAHDSAAVARHMADDAIYEDVALGRVLHGPSEIASFVEEATGSSSDFRFEVVSLFAAGTDYAAAPSAFVGRRLGSSMRVGGSPRTGTTTTSPSC